MLRDVFVDCHPFRVNVRRWGQSCQQLVWTGVRLGSVNVNPILETFLGESGRRAVRRNNYLTNTTSHA
jgi:hypothetical protein